MSYYSEGDTTQFMDYTCPEVDYITENCNDECQEETGKAFSTLKYEIKLLAEKLAKMGDITDDCLNSFLTDANREIEYAEEKLDEEISYCINGINNNIKGNVTYEWREQSINMMNFAFEEGQKDNENLEELKDSVRETLSDLEKYNWLVQWNKDMGNAIPDSVYKPSLSRIAESDMFGVLEDALVD